MVQSVGHLTVNEDGGGSSPPAPANFNSVFIGVFDVYFLLYVVLYGDEEPRTPPLTFREVVKYRKSQGNSSPQLKCAQR